MKPTAEEKERHRAYAAVHAEDHQGNGRRWRALIVRNFSAYWAANGAAIRAGRRQKYAEDPAHREKILKSNKRSLMKARAHGAS